MTPLSGVRISWLIVARNSDLCRDAAIASSRASASWSRERSRSATRLSWSPICCTNDQSCSSRLGCGATICATQTVPAPLSTGIDTMVWPGSPGIGVARGDLRSPGLLGAGLVARWCVERHRSRQLERGERAIRVGERTHAQIGTQVLCSWSNAAARTTASVMVVDRLAASAICCSRSRRWRPPLRRPWLRGRSVMSCAVPPLRIGTPSSSRSTTPLPCIQRTSSSGVTMRPALVVEAVLERLLTTARVHPIAVVGVHVSQEPVVGGLELVRAPARTCDRARRTTTPRRSGRPTSSCRAGRSAGRRRAAARGR